MKKVSDLSDAFTAFKQTNQLFNKYKICGHRISNLKTYITQQCAGHMNFKLVIINQLDESQAAIPDWMLLTQFFQLNLHMYDSPEMSKLSACYNLDKTLTIRKPTITVESLIQCNSPCLSGQFHDTLFVGKRSAFLGIILYNGSILLYRETLLKLLDHEKEFFDCMTMIMNRMQLINSVLYDNAVEGIGQFLHHLSMTNMYMDCRNNIISNITANCHDLKCEDVTAMFDSMEDRIYQSYIQPMIKQSVFGASSVYSYANLLRQMRDTYEQKIRDATSEGYNAGLTRSAVFLNRNYTPILMNGGVHWTKKVAIYPEVAIINNISYQIPLVNKFNTPRREVYYITELTIHPEGSVSAVGRHPNVSSGGTVCLGDLLDRSRLIKSMSNDDLGDFVDRVETLLENINFDSAYFSYEKDFDQDQFIERTNGMSRFALHRKVASGDIQDAVFVDDDGTADDEEDQSENVSTNEEGCDIEDVRHQFESARITVEAPNVRIVSVN